MTEGEKIVQVMKWLCDGHTLKSTSNGCTYTMTDKGLCVRVYENDEWLRSHCRVADFLSLELQQRTQPLSQPAQSKRQVRSVDLSK